MKILQVTPCYLPGRRYGGPIASVHGMSRALAARGHHVEVFTTDLDGWQPLDPSPPAWAMIEGVGVSYFQAGLGRRFHRAPNMNRVLRDRVGEFDLVHLHGMFTWPCYRAAREATRAHVPYVLSPRGMMVQDLVRRRGRGRKELWIKAFDRKTLEGATLVHTTSDLEDRELRKFSFSINWTATIPNGVDIEPFDGDWGCVSPRVRDLKQRDDLILFLGRINWKKGLDRLVRAIAQLDRGHLIVAGSDDGYEDTLHHLIDELGITDRVSFLGQVDGSDKQALLDISRMLVLPSYNENFGNVVLESMAAGLPTVVTSDVGAAALVEAADCGIVVGEKDHDLAGAVGELLADSELCAEMGEAGSLAAEERFSWPAVAQRFEVLYRELTRVRRAVA